MALNNRTLAPASLSNGRTRWNRFLTGAVTLTVLAGCASSVATTPSVASTGSTPPTAATPVTVAPAQSLAAASTTSVPPPSTQKAALSTTTAGPATKGSFTVTSSAFLEGGSLPADYTCDGSSKSPPLSWSGAPEGTVGYAVVMHHLPGDGTSHWYWVLYDLPATIDHIDAGVPPAAKLGTNSVNPTLGYAPPCSKGPGAKVYTLTVYALSAQPTLPNPSVVSRDVLLKAISGTVLAESTLNVTYSRP